MFKAAGQAEWLAHLRVNETLGAINQIERSMDIEVGVESLSKRRALLLSRLAVHYVRRG